MPKAKILILDDDPIIRKSLSKYLEKENIEVFTAGNFKEAVSIQNKNKDISLAVVDYLLPDVKEGVAVEYFSIKEIPTILLTGVYHPKIRKLYTEKNLVDYIFKNIPGALDITVKTVKLFLKYKGSKVLIVDDAKTDRTVIKNYLKTIKLDILEAETIKQAYELVKNNKDIRLILLDYNIPSEDPLQFITDIRKKYPKTKLPIIFVTGNIDENITPILLKSDINDIIRKPFYREELVNRIFNVFDYTQTYEMIEKSAYTDYLTGLYNRRYFLEHGKKLISISKRNNLNIAFILFDIDKFKSINDTYGHDVGDIVLVDFAKKLKKYFSRNEDIVARLGGEEFAILSYFKDFEKLKEHILKFHKQIFESSVFIEPLGKNISYSVSGGVAIDNGKNLNLDSLFKTADEKLYKAKQTGRNKIIF